MLCLACLVSTLVVDPCGGGLGAGVDVGVASPDFHLRRVALRIFVVVLGCLANLIVDPYGRLGWRGLYRVVPFFLGLVLHVCLWFLSI